MASRGLAYLCMHKQANLKERPYVNVFVYLQGRVCGACGILNVHSDRVSVLCQMDTSEEGIPVKIKIECVEGLNTMFSIVCL